MIRYSNIINKKMKFKDFSLNDLNKFISNNSSKCDFSKCLSIFNFDIKNDCLVDGVGIGDLKLAYENYFDLYSKLLHKPEGANYIKACYFLKYWDTYLNTYSPIIIVHCDNNRFYFNFLLSSDTTWVEIVNMYFDKPAISIYAKYNNEDSLILYSIDEGMFVWNYSMQKAVKVFNPPVITSMCMHNNRLFAISGLDQRSIVYSEEFNPINFSISDYDNGYINLNDDYGKCNKIVSFLGNIYVFRDYNIVKITEGRNPNEFDLDNLYVGNGRIFSSTVTICGDKICFLATDGLYSFDGKISKKINLDIDNMIEGTTNNFATGAYFNGSYYLSTRINFNDKFDSEEKYLRNNSLIVLDLNTNKYKLQRFCDITDFIEINDSVNNCLVTLFEYENILGDLGVINSSGEIQGQQLLKYWKSHNYDFDSPCKYKYFKNIGLISNSDVVLELYLDNVLTEINVKGSNDFQVFKIDKRAMSIQFALRTNANHSKISSPILRVGFYE